MSHIGRSIEELFNELARKYVKSHVRGEIEGIVTGSRDGAIAEIVKEEVNIHHCKNDVNKAIQDYLHNNTELIDVIRNHTQGICSDEVKLFAKQQLMDMKYDGQVFIDWIVNTALKKALEQDDIKQRIEKVISEYIDTTFQSILSSKLKLLKEQA